MAHKLSMNKLDLLLKEASASPTSEVCFDVGDEAIVIEVRHVIAAGEMFELVRGVVSNLFDENADGELIYCPERERLAIAANVLSYYTNLKDDLGNDRLVALVYGTDVFEQIRAKISQVQLCDIEASVNKLVGFLCDSQHARQQATIAEAARQIENAANAFKALNEQFSMVGDDKLQRFVDNVLEFKPTDFVKAVAEKSGTEG